MGQTLRKARKLLSKENSINLIPYSTFGTVDVELLPIVDKLQLNIS